MVSEVRNRFDQASAAILTEYRGLTVKDLATLRRSLRDAGGEYRIYKNTLVRFAARDLGLDDLVPLLEGPTAIAFIDGDAVPGGQGPAGLRPDQPQAGRQGRGARQQGHVRRRHRRPGRPAAPRGGPGPAGRRPGRPDAAVRRPAPGPAPQLRLRPEGPDRPGRGHPRPDRITGQGRQRHDGGGRQRHDGGAPAHRRHPPRPTPIAACRRPFPEPDRTLSYQGAPPWQPKKRSSTPSPA